CDWRVAAMNCHLKASRGFAPNRRNAPRFVLAGAPGRAIGHHSYSHPLLNRRPLDRAKAEIDWGIAADDPALYGRRGGHPFCRSFFRFPGIALIPALRDRLQARGAVVAGADIRASDWNE